MQRGQAPMGFDLRPTPMVLRLIIVNFAIWMLFSILVNFAQAGWAQSLYSDELALLPSAAVFKLRFWQMFTYGWLHDLQAPGHILFNLLGLFFLGPSLERRWGPRAFLIFYIWSIAIAGVFSTFAGLVMPGLFDVRVVGASGAVMAILAAFSFTMPEATILLFFVLPIQAKWILWIAVAIDTLYFFSGGPNSSLAYHTHLGGVLAAWLLITGNWRPRTALGRFRLWRLNRRGGKSAAGRSGLRVIDGGKRGPDDRYLN